ncbi:PREDICTED: protein DETOXIFICATION 16 isoform X2 [Theobroma cacao]|uniref:Protein DETOXIFICATION n=1 Tax=Theobroma cacao TaxID=3641 RepID=A0AB32W6D8_THECC|nr:PREDICTED: protein DETOXIFICATION 16 isoform X2 [Theobroma cacao]
MEHEDSIGILESPLIPVSGKVPGEGVSLSKGSCNKAEITSELKKQMRLAGPLVVVSFLQYSLLMISVMFVGHLGELSLASASMATSFAGVTGFSFMLGMGSALETFCGQAYGARQYHMLGVHMQRAILVLTLVSVPISLIWAFTGQVFTILKQDTEISMRAGVYARWMIPSILPYGLLQCQLRFLQTQNNVLPLMISTGITSLVHILVCWTLIFRLGFGNQGAALSSAISYWINVFILAIYIKFSPTCKKTWTGFSKDGRRNLVSFLKLGIPSALMVCLNISSVVYRIPFGFGSAVSVRVSNELGAGKPRAARLAVKIVMLLAVTEGLSLSIIAVALRGTLGYLYTNEEEVVRYLASVMPVLALSNFMDGIQGVLSGTARGCGWQKVGAYVNLGSYYLLGLPSAIILTFVFHFGGKGLWIGITCGSGLQAFLLLVIAMRTNWELEAGKARERVYGSSIPMDLPS